MRKVIFTEKAPAPIGPYVQAVQVDDTLYISGQLGIDMETGEMGDCVVCQATNSLKNMVAILEEAGMTTDNIVKTTIFLDDMNNFGAVNEVYAKFFGESFPARSCVQVAALPKAAKVEIEAVACK